jgi:pyruvate ferredoxin oxidoreductase gamma subunit
MFQVCLHGRGGQGVVTASELLATSAFAAGHQVQAFPSFGSERTGAPVVAYCRIADEPITTHEPVFEPDAVIIQDPTLLDVVDVFAGVDPVTGAAVINTTATPQSIKAQHPQAPNEDRIAAVPADAIVRLYLGANKPSAAMLGAFAAFTGAITLDAAIANIERRFRGRIATANVAAAKIAHQWVKDRRTPSTDVTADVIALGLDLGIPDPTTHVSSTQAA